MPIYPAKCLACGHLFEEIRPMALSDQLPACPRCGGSTEKAYVPPNVSINSPALVVFQAPDGSYRFPGETSGAAVEKYKRMGYKDVSARGWAEVRRLESQVNKQQASEIRQRVERQCQAREQAIHDRRSDFHHGLHHGFLMPELRTREDGQVVQTGRMKTVTLSALSRDVARAAMAKNNAKQGPTFREPGFHSEAFSYDRSNRDESRRPDGHKYHD